MTPDREFDDAIVGYAPRRQRLPNRREQVTESIAVGNAAYEVSVGFDPESQTPKEVFLTGAKAGTDMAFILADAAVVISIALQHGVPVELFAEAVSRVPDTFEGPATRAASVIGAALDLVARHEGWKEQPR